MYTYLLQIWRSPSTQLKIIGISLVKCVIQEFVQGAFAHEHANASWSDFINENPVIDDARFSSCIDQSTNVPAVYTMLGIWCLEIFTTLLPLTYHYQVDNFCWS